MSKGKDYIPAKNSLFNDFQQNMVTRVTANATTWGIASGKVTDLTAAQGIYQPLYNAINNPNTRTKAATTAHTAGRKVYEKYLRDFVKENLVFNSSIPIEGKEALRINPGVPHAGSRPAITTKPVLMLQALAGAFVKFTCRVEGDESRPSLHPDANGVEIKVSVGAPPSDPPKIDTDFQYTLFSSKATFKKDADPTQIGKRVYAIARWKNNTDDAKSGPWCPVQNVMLIE